MYINQLSFTRNVKVQQEVQVKRTLNMHLT